MEKTRKEPFMVSEQGSSIWKGRTPKTHHWFEVLQGEDEGIRVRVPLFHEEYDEEMELQLRNLTDGDVVEAVLVRDGSQDTWKPIELEKVDYISS